MCGISGLLKLDYSKADPSQLGTMSSTPCHRGQDAGGVQVSGPVGLAHARLSIIDLQSGAQPMSTANSQLWITFNGEIFNYIELREELVGKGYQFATRSDTEVILHAYQEYGEDCVNHFNGQWAFAIWDAKRQKLFLSRDRAGVRPLFYCQTTGTFLFASEIKSIFVHPTVERNIDVGALDQVFTYWCTVPPRTMFKGIQELPP